jgi:IS5 family transposase
MKLTTRCDSSTVDGLNEALLARAAEAKLLPTTRLRADTTVVPANVSFPTDAGVLATAVRRIAATGRRIQAAGGATRTRVRDRSRSAGKRAYDLGSKLRLRTAAGKDAARPAVFRVTYELARLAEAAAKETERLLVNARRRARAEAARLASCGSRVCRMGWGSARIRPTAWAWPHKLRRAMVRPDWELLDGVVELVKASWAGSGTGKKGGPSDKVPVTIAVERTPGGRRRQRAV